MASTAAAIIASGPAKSGASPPSSATSARIPKLAFMSSAACWKTAQVAAIASAVVLAAIGTTSTSWMLTWPPACLPPLDRLIVGRGLRSTCWAAMRPNQR